MKRSLFIFLFVILVVNAYTLGSTVDNKYLRGKPGDNLILRSYFFNPGSDDIVLKFTVNKPDGWTTYISPGYTMTIPGSPSISNPTGGKWVYLSSSNKYVPAYPVYLTVMIPQHVYSGDYTVTLLANSQPTNTVPGLSQRVVHSRAVTFKIYVSSSYTRTTTTQPVQPLTTQPVNNILTFVNETLSLLHPNATSTFLNDIVGVQQKGNSNSDRNKNRISISTENNEEKQNNQFTGDASNPLTGHISAKSSFNPIFIVIIILVIVVMIWIYVKI